MEAAGGAVRVMTVHAAKGLEAKIVFLPDCCGAPSGRFDPKIFALEDPSGPTSLVWSPRAKEDPYRRGARAENNSRRRRRMSTAVCFMSR